MQKLNNKWVMLSSAAVAITWACVLWIVIPSAERPEWRRVPLEVLRADPPKPQIFEPKDEPQAEQPRDPNVTTTGPVFPTGTTNDSSYGSVAWTNPNNASADDTSYATVVNNDSLTNYLNPAFSPGLGSDEVIDGIEVTVNRKCTGGCVDDTVKLVFGGVVVGTNKSTGAVWTSSDASVTFGGPTDTWGLTPTFADVNTMEVVFASQMSDVIDTASVDYITVTIYHHTGTPDPDAFRAIIEARSRQQRESMWTLRQSTSSQEVPLGKFVDETDGVTALTALTIANTDIKLQKTGGTTLVSKNSGGATHISGGRYYAVLDATDTDTIGPMKITVDVSGALPVEVWCEVLDEALYDWKYGTTAPGTGTALDAAGVRSAVGLASANLDTQLSTIDTVVDSNLVDTAEIGAAGAGLTAVPWNASWDAEVQSEVQDAIEVNNLDHLVKSAVDTNWSTTVHLDSVIGHMADNGTSATFDRTTDSLEAARDNIGTAGASLSITASVIPNGSGTATAGAATTITLQTALGADDRVIGCEIDLTGGTGSGQTRTATDYVNSTQVLTVDRPWTTNPDNTTTYKIRHANSAVETVCKIGAAFTSTAGTEVRCSAWLERNGQIVTTYAASASCTVTFREHGSGTDLFSVTDSAVNAQGIFEVTQASPAFTSDRLYIASAAITEGGNVFTSRQPVPVR